MKAKKIQNFINESDIEEILLSEPPSRLESFEGDMNKWLKSSNYEAKEAAIDTFNFFTEIKDYVQVEFADNLGYDSLENFRNDTIDLWRVGPIEGLSSFFLSKEAAESYSKRMGIFEPEHYKAKGKDIIPTGAGSGEVIVPEEDVIREDINESIFKGPSVEDADPELKPVFKAIEDLRNHNIKIADVDVNAFNPDHINISIEGMKNYDVTYDRKTKRWKMLDYPLFVILDKNWDEIFEEIKEILKRNVNEKLFKGPDIDDMDDPKLKPLFNAIEDLKRHNIKILNININPYNKDYVSLHIKGMRDYLISFDRIKNTWRIMKSSEFTIFNKSWEETFKAIKKILRNNNELTLKESRFKPKSKEEVERDNPELAPLYDAIKDIESLDIDFTVTSMAGLPPEIKIIRIDGLPYRRIIYFPYAYKQFPKGWVITSHENPDERFFSSDDWKKVFNVIKERLYDNS